MDGWPDAPDWIEQAALEEEWTQKQIAKYGKAFTGVEFLGPRPVDGMLRVTAGAAGASAVKGEWTPGQRDAVAKMLFKLHLDIAAAKDRKERKERREQRRR